MDAVQDWETAGSFLQEAFPAVKHTKNVIRSTCYTELRWQKKKIIPAEMRHVRCQRATYEADNGREDEPAAYVQRHYKEDKDFDSKHAEGIAGKVPEDSCKDEEVSEAKVAWHQDTDKERDIRFVLGVAAADPPLTDADE